MSKLDELIQELCPDGVEFKKVKDVYTRLKGTPITAGKMKEIESPDGEIKIFAGGKTVINARETDIPKANITRVPAVLVQSRGVIDVVYYDKPFTFKNEMWAYTAENTVFVKFLYYVLKNNIQQFRDAASGMGSLPQISLPVTEEFIIPVPPLEIQREIVRILDNFTLLTAELTAELTARQKQYEYYRDKLLTFDVHGRATSDVIWRTLGEVCGLKAGKAIPSYEISPEPTAEYCIPCYGGNGLRGYVRQANQQGEKSLIGRQGALCGNVCYATGDYYATEHAVVVTNKGSFNNRFLYHLLVHENLNQYKTAGAQPGLSVSRLETIPVPVPDIAVQDKIAYVLDNFDAICSDLNIGLPAEIVARQKQYEFYRDKLLTFAATGATISRHDTTRHDTTRHDTTRHECSALIKLCQYVFGTIFVTLDEISANSCSGGTPLKGHSEYYNGGNIPWLRTQEVTFNEIYETSEFITSEGLKNSAARWIPENCVIIAISGASAGRCAINKIPLTTNQHCLNIEVDSSIAMYQYVYYCVCGSQDELLSKKEGARGDLNASRILSLTIPLPPLQEQQRIVSILDRFDALCNDLSSGLPAEIEARQKQYEYYRDRLLTFKERTV